LTTSSQISTLPNLEKSIHTIEVPQGTPAWSPKAKQSIKLSLHSTMKGKLKRLAKADKELKKKKKEKEN